MKKTTRGDQIENLSLTAPLIKKKHTTQMAAAAAVAALQAAGFAMQVDLALLATQAGVTADIAAAIAPLQLHLFPAGYGHHRQ